MSVYGATTDTYINFQDALSEHSDADKLMDDIDANKDGIIDGEEMKAYAARSFTDKIKSISNSTPNSVTGHISNVILGGATVLTSHYAGLDPSISNPMQIAGIAMIGTGVNGLIGSSLKWVTGRVGAQEYTGKVDPRRIV